MTAPQGVRCGLCQRWITVNDADGPLVASIRHEQLAHIGVHTALFGAIEGLETLLDTVREILGDVIEATVRNQGIASELASIDGGDIWSALDRLSRIRHSVAVAHPTGDVAP